MKKPRKKQKSKPDAGHKATDRRLAGIEKEIKDIFSASAVDVQKLTDELMAGFKEQDEKWLAMVESGLLSQEQYKQNRMEFLMRSNRAKKIRKKIAERMTECSVKVAELTKDEVKRAFLDNANFALYEFEVLTSEENR